MKTNEHWFRQLETIDKNMNEDISNFEGLIIS